MKKSFTFIIIILIFSISCSNLYRSEILPDKDFYTKTTDGRKIHIAYFEPRTQVHKKIPVVLCHGLGVSGKFWYLNKQTSLSLFLAERGFKVFVPDMRETGLSISDLKNRYNFTFDDYSKDVSAIIEFVKNETGQDKVHWVGHSMGGIVIYLFVTKYSDEPIETFTAVSSPYSMENQLGFTKLVKKYHKEISDFLNRFDYIPLEHPAAFFSPFAGVITLKFFEKHIWNYENVEEITKKLAASNIVANMNTNVAKKFVNVFLGKEEFGFDLKKLTKPSLFIAGSYDFLALPQSVREAYKNTSAKKKKFVLASKSNGFSTDYGHGDILYAKSSRSEIFPLILDHLENYDKDEEEEEESNRQYSFHKSVNEGYSEGISFEVLKSAPENDTFLTLIGDFGLSSDIWNLFIEYFKNKFGIIRVYTEHENENDIEFLLKKVCDNISRKNIVVSYGFMGFYVLSSLKDLCFDGAVFIGTPVEFEDIPLLLHKVFVKNESRQMLNILYGEDKNKKYSPNFVDSMTLSVLKLYYEKPQADRVFVPILSIASVSDNLVFWWQSRNLHKLGTKNKSEFILLGDINLSADFEHIELITDENAKKYVFPQILRWIKKNFS